MSDPPRINGRPAVSPPIAERPADDVSVAAGGTRRPRGGHRLRTVRCACRRCGAHVLARGLHTIAGECGNCHGYDLVPVE